MNWVAVLRTTAHPRALEQLESALARVWASHEQVPAAIRRQLQIAASEVVANIIEHGSAGHDLVQIEIEISVGPAQVVIAVSDDGNTVDVDLGRLSMPDCLAERGRGLAMARQALGSLSYQCRGGVNRWLLASTPF